MALLLKQSTATTIVLGPFVDSVDGVTAETALTIAQADVRLSKNAAAFAQKGDATSCTHMENGYYSCPLSTTDAGTLGILDIAVNEAGALPVFLKAMVVPANAYDSLVGGTDTLQADVTQWLGTAVATPTTAGIPEVDVTHVSGTAQTARDIGAAVPAAVPGASGGLLIAGANTAATSFTAGVTISNATGSALTLSSSGANGNGLIATGNGSADGIHAEGGATGRGIHARGGATGGAGILAIAQAASDGISATGIGAGAGIHATAGATGNGMTLTGGATSGHGLQATVTSGNEIDANIVGTLTGNITGDLSGSVGSVTGAVASVTGNVGGNVTGSVGSVAAGGITSSSVATGAIDADALATDAVTEIADAVLDRNMATGTDSGTETVRTMRQALRASRNKVSIAAGTATITKEDDTTASWTAAVTTTAGNPISAVDPTSI